MTLLYLLLWHFFGTVLTLWIRSKMDTTPVTKGDLAFSLLMGFMWPIILVTFLVLAIIFNDWWSEPLFKKDK